MSPAKTSSDDTAHGLTVRWSLAGTGPGVEQRLRDYVAGTSHARFSAEPTIRFKTWRMRSGEWFEGCYVFASPEDRAAFQETFTAGAAESPGSRIIGSSPTLVEPCDVVAVAEGRAGFVASPSYRREPVSSLKAAEPPPG